MNKLMRSARKKRSKRSKRKSPRRYRSSEEDSFIDQHIIPLLRDYQDDLEANEVDEDVAILGLPKEKIKNATGVVINAKKQEGVHYFTIQFTNFAGENIGTERNIKLNSEGKLV